MTEVSKKIEEIYQKKTPIEHILIRPDTYIGSTLMDLQQMWVWDDQENMITRKNVNFCPGLYKIFDEILVNAADNKYRDPKMTTIKIDIDQIANSISVYNDGKGIPIVVHKDEKVYVPTMIFGYLLTSSNFDDNEKKVTGGRNGYGAKLCNIFSHKFTVETASKTLKKRFVQVWENNMGISSQPTILDYNGQDYTRVTFVPDLQRFRMTDLDSDFVSLVKKRAYDLAGTTRGVKVYLNNELLPVTSFEKYAALYSRQDINDSQETLYSRPNERWEICVLPSDGSFQHVSFVNSIATTKGGSHVNHVANKIVNRLIEDARKKIKDPKFQLRPQQVKQQFWLFVNAKIENPSFDSQTKENLTLNEKEFGSHCNLEDKFLKKVSDMLTESVVSWYSLKMKHELNKKGATVKRSKLRGIAKLDDANDAGTSHSLECTLILTEGDSAKTMAVAGVAAVGRDKYGIFPLRGKVLNIRETTLSNVLKNKEIENLVKIIGLDFKKKYDESSSLSNLRYGKVMFMTDQDHDGSHIKGLLINLFHYLWPNLLKHNFLDQFITPIVKVKRKDNILSFYSIPEYEEWKSNTPDFKSYSVKYYKGLGTSNHLESKEYFENLKRHRISFEYSGQPCDDAIVLAFSKSRADSRKKWLDNFQAEQSRRQDFGLPQIYLYEKETRKVTYCDFVNKELILFSHADNVRSIPSMVDGLKPGQRKVLYACFTRKIMKDVKVCQLSGTVSELSAYHHGEQSLHQTIVNLAQNFVGSNNINLLKPEGQFGTRIKGGKDAASPRYIFTALNPIAKAIFCPSDEPLLKYLYEDNQSIEPEWYCPIIPMVLVNGADGIGTGYSTKIPNYNPREIVENLKKMIRGQEPEPMLPWFKNFTGNICPLSAEKVIVSGRAFHAGKDTVVVSELPIRVWTQTYKEGVLETLLKGDGNSDNYVLQDYKDYHDESMVNYVLKFKPNYLDNKDDSTLCNVLRLQTSVAINQMVLFDGSGKLHRYATAIDILKDFFNIRLIKYNERKQHMESLLNAELLKLESQMRFIDEKISNKITVENLKKVEMINLLKKNLYPPDPVKAFNRSRAVKNDQPEEETEVDKEGDVDYNYILGMPIWSLTHERREQLRETCRKHREKLDKLLTTTPEMMWLEDLENFLVVLDKLDEEEIKLRLKTQKKTNTKKIKTPMRTREIDCTQWVENKKPIKRLKDNGSLENSGTNEENLENGGLSKEPKKRVPRAKKESEDSKTKKEPKTAKVKKEPRTTKSKKESKVLKPDEPENLEPINSEDPKATKRKKVSKLSQKAKKTKNDDEISVDSIETPILPPRTKSNRAATKPVQKYFDDASVSSNDSQDVFVISDDD